MLIASAAVLSCSPSAPPSPPDPEGVVRIAPLPLEAEGEEPEPPFDPATRARNLARRFPGVSSVGFVRVLLVPEERSGTCWTEVSPPWETGIDLRWTIGGESGEARGIAAAKAKGWWPIYRSPEGFGFERLATFESLDLEVESRFTCRCVNRPVAGSAQGSLRLRFRWKQGAMPEVSAALEQEGRRRGLRPFSVYGHLLTWRFPARPGGDGTSCGVDAALSILNDPPIL